MIRYMITGLVSAALCVSPMMAAKYDAKKKERSEADLISAMDFAPYVLFGGSMIYLYTVKKQCNKLEEELKKQNGSSDETDKLAKRVKALEKQWDAAFGKHDDEDEKDGFEHVPSHNNGSSSSGKSSASSSSSLSDDLNNNKKPDSPKHKDEDDKKPTSNAGNTDGVHKDGEESPKPDSKVEEPEEPLTDRESENEDYEDSKAKAPKGTGTAKDTAKDEGETN